MSRRFQGASLSPARGAGKRLNAIGSRSQIAETKAPEGAPHPSILPGRSGRGAAKPCVQRPPIAFDKMQGRAAASHGKAGAATLRPKPPYVANVYPP